MSKPKLISARITKKGVAQVFLLQMETFLESVGFRVDVMDDGILPTNLYAQPCTTNGEDPEEIGKKLKEIVDSLIHKDLD